MDFQALLTRADESMLQEILGSKTIKVLTTLDQTRSYNKYLRKLVLDLHGADGLLLNKKFRAILFDLFREDEAKVIAEILKIKKCNSSTELYRKIKERSIRRESPEEILLFKYFNLEPPVVEKKEEVPSVRITKNTYPLFEHQRAASRNVKKMLSKEPFRLLLHMPTGSGKTRTAMNIISDHFRDNEPAVVMWLAASEELCEQAAEEFEKAWSFLGNRDIKVYRYWGSYKLDVNNIREGIVIAGLPKIVRSIRSEGINFITQLGYKTSLVVMDEAHQAIAPTYKLVVDTLFHVGAENRLLGLSATPGRTWNDVDADVKLANFFNRKKVMLEIKGYSNPIEYLVDQEYLAKVNYRSMFYESKNLSTKDLESIAQLTDIPLSILKMLGEDEQRNLKIIYEVEGLVNRHKRIILFAPSVDGSNFLSSILRARGHEAYSITGETDPIKRKEFIEEYKNDDPQTKILCNYGVLTTGFDAPKTSAAVIARPTLSLVLYSQMIGRALRGVKAGGNAEAEILTVIDRELPGFNSVTESFNNWEDVWE